MTETDNKPVDYIRLGKIKANIWANQTTKGIKYNATYSKLYKEGDQWKESFSFDRDDSLLLSKVADLVNSKIFQIEKDESQKMCIQVETKE